MIKRIIDKLFSPSKIKIKQAKCKHDWHDYYKQYQLCIKCNLVKDTREALVE